MVYTGINPINGQEIVAKNKEQYEKILRELGVAETPVIEDSHSEIEEDIVEDPRPKPAKKSKPVKKR